MELWICLAVTLPTLLAALEWKDAATHRLASLNDPAGPGAGFSQIAPRRTKIDFVNHLAQATSITNQIYLNGSGVAAADIDGDDLCDLYFCGLESPNRLYRNLGDWQFQAMPQGAIACADQASTGAAFADIDGDNDPDLLVNGIRHGTRLFLNDGCGNFTEATGEWGLRNAHGSTSMALADIDGDGWLDLYVVNYRSETMRDEPDSPFDVRVKNGEYHLISYRGRPATSPDLVGRFTFDRHAGVLENGEADQLFRNTGEGRFTPVAWRDGTFTNPEGRPMKPPYDWGLSAMFRDLNQDGWPDLYVCNDFQSPDRIWINDGTGRFRPIHQQAIQQTSLFSMGLDVADINRDGWNDLFVVDMLSRKHTSRQVQVMDKTAFAQYRNTASPRPQSPRNTLLLNRGNGDYAELARLCDLDASYWSWCPAFIDVDLDGYEDLLITTGHGRDAQNADIARQIDELTRTGKLSPAQQLRLRRRFPALTPPNVAFHNRQNLRFEETGSLWGFDSKRISQGMALADLDNDGDQDVVVNCLNAPPLVLRNNATRPRIRVRLRGIPPNTKGIGATIRVAVPGLPVQTQEIVAAGRYLSADEPSRVFALIQPTRKASIEVAWRSGRRSVITGVAANQLIEIVEPENPPVKQSTPRNALSETRPLFKDVSARIKHAQVDIPYDDFTAQGLLPRKLSEPGPGVTWFDFNGDGWEDLFIGAGRGGRLGVFRNDRNGRFVRQRAKAFEIQERRDQTTILGWQSGPHDRLLLIGKSNYEDAAPRASALRQFSVVTGQSDEELLRSNISVGPMAMADIDGDGDLDLFVGGSHELGRYPRAVSSFILRNQADRLELDREASKPFANAGMVRGALWTHLDADAFPELVIVGEWMSIEIYRNRSGRLTPWNPSIRWPKGERPDQPPEQLADLTGWWNSIAAGDFDGDGRLDLVAGNWGRNTTGTFPTNGNRRIYFETGDSRGIRLLEAYLDPDLGAWVPARDWSTLTAAFPSLKRRYSSFTSFSTARMSDILRGDFPKMQYREARLLDSIVLLNRGNALEARRLPIEAQFAPVYGLAVADMDCDGRMDIVLAQNLFSVSDRSGRQDAGGLLFLRGLGTGRFLAASPLASGLDSHGQGRGLAVCDFNHDGRPDLAAARNNGQTQLFENQSHAAGLRVRFTAGDQNRQAIGTVVRLIHHDGQSGPAREIRLGGGYWSQDSSSLVLAPAGPSETLEIRWPNGGVQRVPIKSGSREFVRAMPSG